MHFQRLLLASLVLIALVACSEPRRRATPDLGSSDLGSTDLGSLDLGSTDLGAIDPDMAIDDAGIDLDAGLDDGGIDVPDFGFDAGRPDLGFDAGRPDLGFDAGRPDLGFDAGRPDLGFDAGLPATGRLVLSEIASGGLGGAGDEFVEIYNAGAGAYDASSVRVEYRSATGTTWNLLEELPPGTILGARRFFLIAASEYIGTTTPDIGAAFTSALAGTGGHIRLLASDGSELDRCGWGTAVEPEGTAAPAGLSGAQSRERKAFAASTPTSMAVGGADGLRGNGYDSGDNGVDFIVREIAEPQNSTSVEVP